MSLIDGILITLLNTVVCLVLPKFLSVILPVKKTQINQEEQKITEMTVPTSEHIPEIPSFSLR
ncbi:hypothetical protein H5968_00595 [Sphaerospermopsis sp. LEGE 00249]|jgi:hypothetical protein|uniref:hypothetical protein n=1 Tax=Sphaerospermopsis sp. LEGE 00249 TaxID=1380707 RepID=UPI00164D9E0A|nr:hypothetical protein [Sphaerospermopsis sp. LEGE 00249]MBC5793694.1 hypothetical protein [Sphaerospermopsis sp. LEGE 00249]